MTSDDLPSDREEPRYKYSGEGAIAASADAVYTLPPAALYRLEPDQEEALGNCNVYAITSSPRLAVEECKLVSPGKWRVRWLRSTLPSETIELEVDITKLVAAAENSHMYRPENVRLAVSHNGTQLDLLNSDSTLVYAMAAAESLAIIAKSSDRFPDVVAYFDQTVEYVGQAIGRTTPRSAIQRLKSHATLQRILAELGQRTPDRAVLLVLFEFHAQDNIIVITPDGLNASVDLDASATYAEQIWSAKPDPTQLTTLAEASMIRYFQPPYNKEYRFTFPKAGQSSYSTYYELNANSVGFSFSTRGTGRRLIHGNRPAQWEHGAMFNLESESGRRSLKEIFVGHGLEDFFVDPD